MCGEQICAILKTPANIGSPPRVRGTVDAEEYDRQRNGITPACAGNSIFHTVNAALVRDHPRVCGEQIPSFFAILLNLGSPPRVRGTVNAAYQPMDNKGITPACAGNRSLVLPSPAPQKDHPRVCGEQPM